MKKKSIVFVFSDQHRMQATGYAGDPNVHTPNMDRLRKNGTDFPYAIANCPVCCPNRASLLTGQYPLTHRVIYNDVSLSADSISIAHTFKRAGYDTAYIGKWHVNGKGRSAYIPPCERLGFDYWRVLECTHSYNHSMYYAEDDTIRMWEGYDVFAQTDCAVDYINSHKDNGKPFFLMLSWGPPHDPYHSAPQTYRDRFADKAIKLRKNVPEYTKPYALKNLPGYYAHIEAIDDALGKLLDAVTEDTVFIYTSDHGDMLGSQGWGKKQKPWDENIRIPFLLKDSDLAIRSYDGILNTPDMAPTLLGLCGIKAPPSMEGRNLSGVLHGVKEADDDCAYILNAAPFGEWSRSHGGREWRGVRTVSDTYCITKSGPWLLYDNIADPYQLNNLIGNPAYAGLQKELDAKLKQVMRDKKDDFLFGDEYADMWGYQLNENGTVNYT